MYGCYSPGQRLRVTVASASEMSQIRLATPRSKKSTTPSQRPRRPRSNPRSNPRRTRSSRQVMRLHPSPSQRSRTPRPPRSNPRRTRSRRQATKLAPRAPRRRQSEEAHRTTSEHHRAVCVLPIPTTILIGCSSSSTSSGTLKSEPERNRNLSASYKLVETIERATHARTRAF